MDIEYAAPLDFNAWIVLAQEVEPLFGPMAGEPGFEEALRGALSQGIAFCIRAKEEKGVRSLIGGVVVSPETNEIAWLAVSGAHRGKGRGRALLEFAMDKLDRTKDIRVQTFAQSVPGGEAARKLYFDLGFTDYEDGGPNPAGIPTVIMKRAAD